MLSLAIAQAPSDLADWTARVAWLEAHLPEVAAQGADLLVLPELFACGYFIGDQLQHRAEPRDGETAKQLQKLAQAHGLAIHCGYAERSGETLYNSAICIGPDGVLLGHQRKLAIPPGFERDFLAPGDGVSVFEFRGFKIATLICYDAEFPETFRHVAALGAELVLVPTALGADWNWVAETMIPTRAYENGVFLAYANGAGQQGEMSFLGKSVIATPDGRELARAGAEPEILYADLEHALVAKAQARLPYLKDRLLLNLS